VLTSTSNGSSVMLNLAAGQVATPMTVSGGGVGFRGLSSGTTSVSAAGGALQPCGSPGCNCGGSAYVGVVNVTVN